MVEFLKKLQFLLSRRDRQLLIGLFMFSIIISIVETVGISAIMPFISVATDFSLIQTNRYYNQVNLWFNFQNEIEFVIVFGMVLILFYILRSAINLLYFHMLARFTQSRYHLLAYRLFENYLGMPYHEFVKKNSSTLTKSIINEANNLTLIISSFLLMLSEVTIIIFIYGMMIYVNWKITLILTCILVLNALLLTKTVSKRIKKSGGVRAEFQKKFYEIINRTFGNFKLIKLQSNDQKALEEFSDACFGYTNANIKNATLQHFPRLFLEAIGFGLITFIVTFLVWKYQSDIRNLLAAISMFVLALYRLMPAVNRIMHGYNVIMFNHKALEIIHNDLMYDQELLGDRLIRFQKNITLRSVDFEYDAGKPVLNHVDLEIKKGEKIAFVGESGSGKSTLVDIIIGIYRPVNGEIFVDGEKLDNANIRQWRSYIGYIPQSVYLFDGTIAQNVVFGREYDESRIIRALEKANILAFLEQKEGILTQVGEGGIMLSGGQKQRIAIARAVYGDPEVLVLDEATSALDSETENRIMEEIYNIATNKTLIIIAHRLSTIKHCDKVYQVRNGTIMVQAR